VKRKTLYEVLVHVNTFYQAKKKALT